MLVPKGAERDPAKLEEVLLDAALKRALNPLDVTAQDFGPTPSVPAAARSAAGRHVHAGRYGSRPADRESPPEFAHE
jgi:hypothetical protein